MPYHGPDPARMQRQQQDHHFASHSHTLTWTRYVSASGGVPAAGLLPSGYYVSTPVSALLAPVPIQPETHTIAGQIAAGQFQVVTKERLARQDLLIWEGVSYRVVSVPVQATLTSGWMATISREDT